MTNERDWQRPKKPYTVIPEQIMPGYDNRPYDSSSRDRTPAKKSVSKPKQIVVPAKNNSNNQILHECVRAGGLVKISINNALCTDSELLPTYEGRLVRFDDFTVLIEGPNGSFLINKSSIAVVEFIKNVQD